MQHEIPTVSTLGFAAAIFRTHEVMFVLFGAEGSASSRSFEAVLASAAEEVVSGTSLLRVDVDASPLLADRYGVRSPPTLIALRDGAELARTTGGLSRDRLAVWLSAVRAPLTMTEASP